MPGASVDVRTSPPPDPSTPGDRPELPAVDLIDLLVSAGHPVMSSDGFELPSAEPVCEPAFVSQLKLLLRASRAGSCQHTIRHLDDAPCTLGRMKAQSRSLVTESSALGDCGVEEPKMNVLSRDEEVSAPPGDGGDEEAQQCMALCAEVYKGMVELSELL